MITFVFIDSLPPEYLLHTFRWRNDDRVRTQFVHSEKVSLDEHKRWFRAQMEKDPKPCAWLIFVAGKPVGQVWLYDAQGDAVTFGRFMIGEEDYLGKGVGKAALGMVLETARVRGFKKVKLSVKESNAIAVSLYRKAGFSNELAHDGMIDMELAL